ncbi:uncharacterized protein LOC129336674 isoform X2 [Eublepharis macularius]|nr:uncharacterized protein LOC129336674 isoform X2 [Eublepharis macularius]XP_054845926.1 uncharacterized protein LOC129336674 isoform X2 [Eublepharis macularius]
MARSLSFLTMEVDPGQSENVMEGSEEVFSNEVVTIKLEDIGSSTPSDLASSPEDHSSDLHSAPESGQFVEDHRNRESIESEECSQPPCPEGMDDRQELIPANYEPTANTTISPENGQEINVPELSPAIRLANARNRKRRVALLSEVAERMLTQCSTEEREANRRHKETLDEERRWRRELMEEERRRHNQLIEEARQDRQVFKDVMSQNMTVMLSAVQALNNLTQMIAEKQKEQQSQSQTAATLPPVQEALSSHEPHQKCPCAGRKNTR